MKIFERTSDKGYGNRINFVDENNVVVGYDFGEQCCESFGYVFVSEVPKILHFGSEQDHPDVASLEFDHSKYVFDPKFFINNIPTNLKYDCGYVCAFRLVSIEEPDIFLLLYNVQNGYYSHGFDMKIGDTVLQKGEL